MNDTITGTDAFDDCERSALSRGISRRSILFGAVGFTAWASVPRFALAGTADPRFMVVILRGGMDGLSAVAPVGDPALATARGHATLGMAGVEPGLPLDNLFELSPKLPGLAALYKAREAVVFHAFATPYRNRSHFDAQNVLESGLIVPGGGGGTGWLGRAVAALPDAGSRIPSRGFASGADVPLVMRGPAPVVTWLPPGFPEASEDTRARLLDLYRKSDPGLAVALEEGLSLMSITGGEAGLAAEEKAAAAMDGRPAARQFAAVASIAGKLMSEQGGPRVGAIDFTGWDTHTDNDPVEGRLGTSLSALDGALGTLKSAMGPAWSQTAVLVVTEFGRTVAINGTGGTDHGTATVAFLVGGAVNGGRVISDWPGLAPGDLYEGRDLKPTGDVRAIAKGVLRDHLGFGEQLLAAKVFPESGQVKPIDGLIRSA